MRGVEIVQREFYKYEEAMKLSYEHAVRMLLHLRNIKEHFEGLEDPDEITQEMYRDSIIKKYEMLEDLTWKLLSKIFKSTGLEINNPRGCYKQAFKEGWIKDIEIWDEILLARNSTAHIYEEEDCEQVKDKIIKYYIDAIAELLEYLSGYIRELGSE